MNPTLFISHGAPNIVLSDSQTKKNARELASSLDIPKYIIIVSAHWSSRDLKVINPNSNELMYDFYGFEEELYNFKYKISSNKELTNNLIEKLKKQNIDISIDENRISYDHGVWSTLYLLYEELNIPIIQLSIPISYSILELINLGEKLKEFKNEALLIFSGGLTHNLRDMSFNSQIKDYAKIFNDEIKNIISLGDEEKLVNIDKNRYFYQNHPTIEHFIPLLIAFGSAINKKGKSFNSEILYSNISMESFIFDEKDKR
ncbi:DODA-type extradiol aromatic ring-opening family dioxygenase [Arcobacter porcinus]|uniref:Dioxygenase, 4,5-DOPA dioxygenase family n=1 Tax=Arcobacter porcinus TaxID=1935204 RepID=A0A1C0AX95_9BACT|nr:class III extradiol ring-cleavage dioxygenase [Arcobacter porcinus]OCL97248.1 LigB family dioxygenase [Aliarcobacter thereius]OCL84149.1 LigB family dioxygenase [Arcobacter porcinus]OCL84673.1 LigB family dioxygenase [Arcobacter porcinus]OCL89213.1 LigB family dioxygenase [Arcobacter porcinus]OCL91633.1 LigB family dioxygenase [Arcobacter porcinus]